MLTGILILSPMVRKRGTEGIITRGSLTMVVFSSLAKRFSLEARAIILSEPLKYGTLKVISAFPLSKGRIPDQSETILIGETLCFP